MTEESLAQLSTADLIDIMVKKVNELLEMHRRAENVFVAQIKQKEVQMVQRVIAARKLAEAIPQPGSIKPVL